MGDRSAISWTDASWNPVRGCSRVSEGCRHCYAETMAGRFCGPGQPYEGLAKRLPLAEGDGSTAPLGPSRWTGQVRLVPEHLADPIRWRRPRRIFVNSMSDLFHDRLTNEEVAAVFGVMAAAPQHTFQVLTKRPARMRAWFDWIPRQTWARDRWIDEVADAEAACGEVRGTRRASDAGVERAAVLAYAREHGGAHVPYFVTQSWPLPNVWLGVSVENQAAADERIPHLLATPAAVRFLSCEPLLGPLNLAAQCPPFYAPHLRSDRIAWVIAGCESGPGARPADAAWFRSLRDQCAATGVAFFLKQAVETPGPGGVGGSSEAATDRFADVIGAGPGSKPKGRGVIELPYLDGVQYANFPGVSR